MTMFENIIVSLIVAWCTGYGFGLLFRVTKQFIEKIGGG